jgi:hypothetical protein
MSDVYVVEHGYDYEGHDALWAGTDREAAFQFADAVTYGDDVRVTRFDPLPVEIWSRRGYSERPHELTYEHREAAPGAGPRCGPFVKTESLVREQVSP